MPLLRAVTLDYEKKVYASFANECGGDTKFDIVFTRSCATFACFRNKIFELAQSLFTSCGDCSDQDDGRLTEFEHSCTAIPIANYSALTIFLRKCSIPSISYV